MATKWTKSIFNFFSRPPLHIAVAVLILHLRYTLYAASGCYSSGAIQACRLLHHDFLEISCKLFITDLKRKCFRLILWLLWQNTATWQCIILTKIRQNVRNRVNICYSYSSSPTTITGINTCFIYWYNSSEIPCAC